MMVTAWNVWDGRLCNVGCMGMDNETAFVRASKDAFTVSFFNHAYDLGFTLGVGDGKEMEHGKVPVTVRGDGGNMVSYADQYHIYADVRQITAAVLRPCGFIVISQRSVSYFVSYRRWDRYNYLQGRRTPMRHKPFSPNAPHRP